MGDPAHFRVLGGANPHTRDRWGRRKRVDADLARRQWARLRDLLRDLGIDVRVVPPDPRCPGLVYPANAGVRLGRRFVLANLIETRTAERPHYRRAIEAVGLEIVEVGGRFEGEADLFRWADAWIFTSGRLERQRFVPRLGLPPWRRVYGFRSDPALAPVLESMVAPAGLLPLTLTDERYYHGDTCLCAFGPGRAHLLAHLGALAPASREALRARAGDALVEVGAADAAIYAANSFWADSAGVLVMPEGVSADLRARVRERGAPATTIATVDVSEFLKKGGGSVKCMILDLTSEEA
jgi:N-dimethylarginine dimethylaminohydrolase